MYHIQLEQFEGPLDLLLRLTEEQKLDITTISLAKVTDQYLDYIAGAPDLATEELADFLVVAAKLLLIKSRTLIPTLDVEDDDGIDLEAQLRMYKEYYEASKRIHQMVLARRYSFARSSTLRVVPNEKKFRPPQSVTSDDLARFFRIVLKRLEPFVTVTEDVIIRTVNIREKIDAIRKRILASAEMQFETLLSEAKDRTDIIVTFLAILELVKTRTIDVVQRGSFASIAIASRKEPVV